MSSRCHVPILFRKATFPCAYGYAYVKTICSVLIPRHSANLSSIYNLDIPLPEQPDRAKSRHMTAPRKYNSILDLKSHFYVQNRNCFYFVFRSYLAYYIFSVFYISKSGNDVLLQKNSILKGLPRGDK